MVHEFQFFWREIRKIFAFLSCILSINYPKLWPYFDAFLSSFQICPSMCPGTVGRDGHGRWWFDNRSDVTASHFRWSTMCLFLSVWLLLRIYICPMTIITFLEMEEGASMSEKASHVQIVENYLDGCVWIRKSTQRCIDFSIHRALNTTEFCVPYLLPKCAPDARDRSQNEVVVLEKFTSDPFPCVTRFLIGYSIHLQVI